MAITTMAGMLAGMRQPIEIVKGAAAHATVPAFATTFYDGGYPPAAAAPTPGIGGEVLTSYLGQIPFTNPVSGNTYLSRFDFMCSAAVTSNQNTGTALLCDRLWHNSGIDVTLTTEQILTGAAQIPSRDQNGSNLGHGVFAALELGAGLGAGLTNVTLKYTNQAGTTGKTCTLPDPLPASPGTTSFFPFGLAAGDEGIRKVESITLGGSLVSGTIYLVLFRIIARAEYGLIDGQGGQNRNTCLDALSLGAPRMYDNSVPFLVLRHSGAGTSGQMMRIIYSQG